MQYARIIGTGSYLPKKILTNADLEKMVQTSDQWIVERTGIKKRHILATDETLEDMVEAAATRALQASGINKQKIGLLIVATATGGYTFPSVACMMQQRLGLANCPAFDINAACTGFIYALSIVDQYIKNKAVEYALIVGSEALSRVTDWEDRSTCVLFGDGAGAAVLAADNIPGIRSAYIHANGNYQELLYAPNCFTENQTPYIKMRGNEVFKIAVTKLGEVVKEIITANNLTTEDIDWLIPHQANLRIVKATARKIKLPHERVIITVAEHGNTSAASVPLALDYGIRSGKIAKGDTLLLEAFGAAFTWGAALIDY